MGERERRERERERREERWGTRRHHIQLNKGPEWQDVNARSQITFGSDLRRNN